MSLRFEKDYHRRAGVCERKAALLLILFVTMVGLVAWRGRSGISHDSGNLAKEHAKRYDLSGKAARFAALAPAQQKPEVTPLSIYNPIAQFGELSEKDAKYVIWGKIVSSDRAPISAATVSLYAALGAEWKGERLIGATNTDASGTYKMVLDAPPKGNLLVTKPGFIEVVSSSLFEDSCSSFRRDMMLVAASVTVSGRVKDEAGNPISGVHVGATTGHSCRSQSCTIYSVPTVARTDGQGRFELSTAPERQCWITAYDEQFEDKSTQIDLSNGREYTVDLTLSKVKAPVRFLTVRVMDTLGLPIRHARFEGSDRLMLAAVPGTAEDGISRVSQDKGNQTEPSEIRVLAPGYVAHTAVVEPDQQQLEVMLDRDDELTGRVTSPDGQSIEGANIFFKDAQYARTVKTGEYGYFSVPFANPPAEYIQVSKRGYKVVDLTLGPDWVPWPLTVTMEPIQKPPAGDIYGRVADFSGVPGYAFNIHIFPLNDQIVIPTVRPFISPDGQFTISDMPEGSYNLCARLQDDLNPFLCPVPYRIEVFGGRVQGPILLRLQEITTK